MSGWDDDASSEPEPKPSTEKSATTKTGGDDDWEDSVGSDDEPAKPTNPTTSKSATEPKSGDGSDSDWEGSVESDNEEKQKESEQNATDQKTQSAPAKPSEPELSYHEQLFGKPTEKTTQKPTAQVNRRPPVNKKPQANQPPPLPCKLEQWEFVIEDEDAELNQDGRRVVPPTLRYVELGKEMGDLVLKAYTTTRGHGKHVVPCIDAFLARVLSKLDMQYVSEVMKQVKLVHQRKVREAKQKKKKQKGKAKKVTRKEPADDSFLGFGSENHDNSQYNQADFAAFGF